MQDNQKESFKQMMVTVCHQYKREEPSLNLVRLWWHGLKFYDLKTVNKSLEKWIFESEYMPTVSDIVKLCRQTSERERLNLQNKELAQLGYKKKSQAAKDEFSAKLHKAMQQAKLKQKRHPKAWAVKILERHSRGDYDSILGLQMAKEVVAELTTKEREELCLK